MTSLPEREPQSLDQRAAEELENLTLRERPWTLIRDLRDALKVCTADLLQARQDLQTLIHAIHPLMTDTLAIATLAHLAAAHRQDSEDRDTIEDARDDLDALQARIAQLPEQWRGEGARIDTFHATMGTGYKVCADQLAAALKEPT